MSATAPPPNQTPVPTVMAATASEVAGRKVAFCTSPANGWHPHGRVAGDAPEHRDERDQAEREQTPRRPGPPRRPRRARRTSTRRPPSAAQHSTAPTSTGRSRLSEPVRDRAGRVMRAAAARRCFRPHEMQHAGDAEQRAFERDTEEQRADVRPIPTVIANLPSIRCGAQRGRERGGRCPPTVRCRRPHCRSRATACAGRPACGTAHRRRCASPVSSAPRRAAARCAGARTARRDHRTCIITVGGRNAASTRSASVQPPGWARNGRRDQRRAHPGRGRTVARRDDATRVRAPTREHERTPAVPWLVRCRTAASRSRPVLHGPPRTSRGSATPNSGSAIHCSQRVGVAGAVRAERMTPPSTRQHERRVRRVQGRSRATCERRRGPRRWAKRYERETGDPVPAHRVPPLWLTLSLTCCVVSSSFRPNPYSGVGSFRHRLFGRPEPAGANEFRMNPYCVMVPFFVASSVQR